MIDKLSPKTHEVIVKSNTDVGEYVVYIYSPQENCTIYYWKVGKDNLLSKVERALYLIDNGYSLYRSGFFVNDTDIENLDKEVKE